VALQIGGWSSFNHATRVEPFASDAIPSAYEMGALYPSMAYGLGTGVRDLTRLCGDEVVVGMEARDRGWMETFHVQRMPRAPRSSPASAAASPSRTTGDSLRSNRISNFSGTGVVWRRFVAEARDPAMSSTSQPARHGLGLSPAARVFQGAHIWTAA
jgi:hypothetical protein